MSIGIRIPALDPERGESYETSTHPGPHGVYHASVTGPFVRITGDPFALQELGQALIDAGASALFATDLRVDQAGPLQNLTAAQVDLSGQSPERVVAYEAWVNTTLVWGTAGETMLPVGPNDWIGNSDGTATAQLDDDTALHFTDSHLRVRSRCRHGHHHETTLTRPAQLADTRREAEGCPGHEDRTA
ncbi:hypothetical protein ABT224_20225 [Streptomyces sp. NPDC001584]|uniref:hypothetical protein n=1 Tax=Streptomyces sp. NPDC001584 TaxID=3154521 RepID=UPI00331983A7